MKSDVLKHIEKLEITLRETEGEPHPPFITIVYDGTFHFHIAMGYFNSYVNLDKKQSKEAIDFFKKVDSIEILQKIGKGK